MKDIFNDSKFDKWLYGGVHDLDEDIGMLIYYLYKLDFIKTTWSCSGHIGKHLMDAGNSSRENYFVYQPGILFFEIKIENDHSKHFIQELAKLVNNYKFASLKIHPKNEYHLFLEMKDLVEESKTFENKEKQEGIANLLLHFHDQSAKHKEVRIDLAQKRYLEFKDFWCQLENIAKKYLK